MSSAESSHSSWHLVSLDKNSCLNLQQILEVFSAPISEEQAWAVLYQVFPTVILKGDIYYLSQVLRCFYNLLRSFQGDFYTIRSPQDILIECDGSVHDETFCGGSEGRRAGRLESAVVADIGMTIYDCLDFRLDREEQRTLSERLEQIIDRMVSAEEEEEAEDEGLGEEEVVVRRSGIIEEILEKCREHLERPSQAETHYRAVCR